MTAELVEPEIKEPMSTGTVYVTEILKREGRMLAAEYARIVSSKKSVHHAFERTALLLLQERMASITNAVEILEII